VTKLATSNTRTEAEIADTDRLVLESIRKVVLSLGHGANEDTYAFIWCKALDVVFDPNHFRFKGQCDLPAVWRKVIRDWALDDLEKLFLRVD